MARTTAAVVLPAIALLPFAPVHTAAVIADRAGWIVICTARGVILVDPHSGVEKRLPADPPRLPAKAACHVLGLRSRSSAAAEECSSRLVSAGL